MNKSIFILIALLFLQLTIISAREPVWLCLSKGDVVEFSKCNPNMDDSRCNADDCKQCVSYEGDGIFCTANFNSCKDLECSSLSDFSNSNPNQNPENNSTNQNPNTIPVEISTRTNHDNSNLENDSKNTDDNSDLTSENNLDSVQDETLEDNTITLSPSKQKSNSINPFLIFFSLMFIVELFVAGFLVMKVDKKKLKKIKVRKLFSANQ